MKIYKVELYNDNVSLIEAENLDAARRQALREHGTDNVRSVSKASPSDIAWVRAMGGRVPSSVEGSQS